MEEQTIKPKYHNLTQWQFFLMMMLPVTLWALAFPFIKIGLEELSFINLTIMRFLVVCMTFLLLIAFKRKWFSKLHKKRHTTNIYSRILRCDDISFWP